MSYKGRLSGAERWTHDGSPDGVPIIPSYFLGPNMSRLGAAFGAELDNRAEQILRGRLAAIPYAGGPGPGREGAARLADGRLIECEEYALEVHSTDRGIPLYVTEGPLSKRIRLANWHQLHRARGTHWGAIDHVRPYFADAVLAGFAYPAITIVSQTNEPTPRAVWSRVSPTGVRRRRVVSPSNFNYRGTPGDRTVWWAFIEMLGTGFTPPALWGGFSWGDGTLWGEGGVRPFTAARAADVAAMLDGWRGAHGWLGGVVAVWPGFTALDPAAAPTQDADGRWSLPNGANTWAGLVDPGTGKATRPKGWQWIWDQPAP